MNNLFTRHCQLSLCLNEKGKLLLCYWGRRLSCPEDALIHPTCSWPLISTDDDARSLPGNYSGEYALHVRMPDGTQALDLRCTSLTQEGTALVLQQEDPLHPGFHVHTRLIAWEDEDIWEIRTTLRNDTNGPITLLRALSAALPLQAGRYYLNTFRGAWSGESYWQEEELKRGNTLCVNSGTVIKSAQEGTPGFVIGLDSPAQEEEGRCILGALCWSGDYLLSFRHSAYGHLFVGMGHDFSTSPYLLVPGQEISLPTALLIYSDHGKGEASRRLHRYLRSHVLPRGREVRRSLLNSWEGVHFDLNESTLLEMIDRTADLGIELFVLDDGWFGHRQNDTSSLGDWQPDLSRLPQGLHPLMDRARQRGIGFGLWIEPEMVSPDSDLFRIHPDWALQLPGRQPREERHQLVLDLTRPAVQQFIEQTLAHLLNTYPGISYIKWDCNRKVTDWGSPYLPPEQQGNLAFDYVTAYYRLMARLRQRFPQVIFQCCSAGGGRLDLGAAAFHEEFWISDNTDALERLRMQWGISHFFPANAMGSHVTVSPNLYTGRATSLKFRFDVALGCRLGLELDPRILAAEELNEIRQRLQLAAQLRPITQLGDLYRLVSPYHGPDTALLFIYGSQALLLAYTSERLFTDQRTRIPLQGLNSLHRYRLQELGEDSTGFHCPLNGCELGGDTLLANGIPIHWNRPLQSCCLLLESLS